MVVSKKNAQGHTVQNWQSWDSLSTLTDLKGHDSFSPLHQATSTLHWAINPRSESLLLIKAILRTAHQENGKQQVKSGYLQEVGLRLGVKKPVAFSCKPSGTIWLILLCVSKPSLTTPPSWAEGLQGFRSEYFLWLWSLIHHPSNPLTHSFSATNVQRTLIMCQARY